MNAEIHAILTDLSTAQKALRESGHAFDDAVAQIGATLTAIRDANHAQGRAIDAVIAATDKALALFKGAQQ